MQHEDAIRTHAAERYLLGEMAAEERDRYEEHYFSCEQCAVEVSAASALSDSVRAGSVAGVPSANAAAADSSGGSLSRNRSSRGFWSSRTLIPALSMAALVLLAVAGYQGLAIIPELRRQLADYDTLRDVPTVSLRSAARGTGVRLVVNASDRFAVLHADMLPERKVATYVASLQSADGREHFRTTVDAPDLGMPVTLLVPVDTMAAGDYVLVFHDEDDATRELGRFVFTVERR
jgi:anti-sigma factor RsiW